MSTRIVYAGRVSHADARRFGDTVSEVASIDGHALNDNDGAARKEFAPCG